MGAVTFSIDIALVDHLQRLLPMSVFVETGTFRGDTLELVKDKFAEIHSVELAIELYRQAAARFSGLMHVDIASGDSAGALARWAPRLRERSVLYFLDAHWCGAERTEGASAQCPVLEEINAIAHLNQQSVLVIDDARLFLASPPAPHTAGQWPPLTELIPALLRLAPTHGLMVLNDTFVVYPQSVHEAMQQYARSAGTDWLAVMSKGRDYDNLRQQFDGLRQQLLEKERALVELKRTCDQREALIDELSAAHEQPRADELPATGELLGEALKTLQHIHAELAEQRQLTGEMRRNSKEQLDALLLELLAGHRERGRQQEHAIAQLQGLSWKQRLRARVGRYLAPHRYPKLGRLWHHDPIPIQHWGLPPAVRYDKYPSWPRISLVTPSFRQAEFIGRTIDSILDQSYPNLQYFVQDGGSQDDTIDILRSYEQRLSGWVSETDSGQSQAINRGFARTDGDIMAWLNSDDLLMPGTLAYVADYFVRHPEISVVYGHRILIDAHEREIGRWILPRHGDSVLSWADFIPQETLFWRRSIWEKAGGHIDENFRFAMDWDLLLRFRKAGARMVRLPKFLGAFRIHEAQKTSTEIHEVGMKEMEQLRIREIGRKVENREIRRAIAPYLSAHVAHDILARLHRRLER